MKKVLIALDYEPSAERIATTGKTIADALGAEITLLHVVAEPAYYSSTDYSPIFGFTGFINAFEPELTETLKDKIHEISNDFLNQSKTKLGDEAIHTLVMEGDFASTIVAAAKSQQADLIVMGSHHRRGLDKLLLDNVAKEVLELTKIPVLVIPIGD